MSKLSVDKLREIGHEIHERVKRRLLKPDPLDRYVREICGRKTFGRGATNRPRLLHHIVTAERDLGYVSYYGLSVVIRSLFAIERGNDRGFDHERPEKDIPESLAEALNRSYDERHDLYRIAIEKLASDHYTLRIDLQNQSTYKPFDVTTSVPRADVAANEPLTRAFWAPYLSDSARTEIAYGLPLFTRIGQGDEKVYTRRINTNKPGEAKAKYKDEEISWAFVTLGDVLCMHRLMGWLQQRGAALDTHGYDYTTDLEEFTRTVNRSAQVLALGSPRVCGLISVYQGVVESDPAERRLPFQIGLDSVVKYEDQKAVRTFTEKERADGLVESPVVVTRRPGALEGVVTMIAGNHGRAVERVGEILTDETQFGGLLQAPALNSWARALPQCFQLLLSVRVHARIRVQEKPSVLDFWSE